MKFAHGILFVLIIGLVGGCKTSAPTVKSLAEYKGRKLEYGSQGGVSGGGIIITILENGQVFSATTTLASETPVNETLHGQTNAKEALAIVNEAEALVKKYPDQNGAGNMTYFLVYHDGSTPHRITWAAEQFPPEEIKAFMKKVSQFVER